MPSMETPPYQHLWLIRVVVAHHLHKPALPGGWGPRDGTQARPAGGRSYQPAGLARLPLSKVPSPDPVLAAGVVARLPAPPLPYPVVGLSQR